MRQIPLATALAVLVVACAPRPAFRPGGAFAPLPEKRVLVALAEVHADEAQRRAVLEAYDQTTPRLRALADEAESLQARWQDLDRRNAGFTAQVLELAERTAGVSRERMRQAAAFERQVATALDADQWQAWCDFWSRAAAGPLDGPEEGFGGGGHRRRRG